MCSWIWENLKRNLLNQNFQLWMKKNRRNMDSSTSKYEISENVYPIFKNFLVSFLWSMYLRAVFLWFKQKIYLSWSKGGSIFIKRVCHVNALEILTNEKHFWRAISQKKFSFGLITKLPRIIVVRHFSPDSFKLKRGFLPPSLK